MKALELVGEVDEQRQLHAALPADAVPGAVRVLVLWPENTNGANGGVPLLEATQADEESAGADWAKLRQLIRDCAVDTGIEDLAHQHDHYLYGKPKKSE